ncbi:MAG: sigma-54-dependent Fis family transcriptional regulator [Myxococcales bacterium]|nr:sigma-54-dependent Fis family transcriptional regulator [Myxococcales bacterium]
MSGHLEAPKDQADHVARERDLYRALLELGDAERDVGALLHGVLSIVRDLTGAEQLFLQAGADLEGQPPYWAAIGASEQDVNAARAHVSRSILREALAKGDVVETACALQDRRFDAAGSVRANRVGAVICASLGGDPDRGVLYVQGARGGGGLHRDAARLVATTARAIAVSVEREVQRAQRAAREDATREARERLACEEVVGRSMALARALDLAALAAVSDSPVLLTGPSGTGKSLVARAIACGGSRRAAPFVEINCAALPSELVESELFGAARGAHSTATESRPGLVASAEGGTLFLDELAELPLTAQAKLLHLTQTGTYHRLGESTPRRANVRIIAATNADVRAELDERRLRRDLYYRLAVVEVEMPALDERREDVPLLAQHLALEVAKDLRVTPLRVSSEALARLERRSWPGNVRELRNAIELGVLRARAESSAVLEARHLEPRAPLGAESLEDASLQARTQVFQRDVIEAALRAADGRAAVAARELGLSRSHLYHLITTLGVRRE